MLIDLAELSPNQIYHMMVQTIIPRPIAWVLSDHGNGKLNLAPFSYFNGVCSDPPLIMISVGRKADGSRKDTWVNIDQRRDFVLHIPRMSEIGAVAASAASLGHGESEIEAGGLETQPVAGWPLPRLEGPAVAMWCERDAIHEVGAAPQALILGRIKSIWVDDAVGREVDGRLSVDAAGVDPLARLGGADYAALGERLSAPRPK